MRGRSEDYDYLEPEILKILKESDVPMSALGINFRVNNKFDKIVELNTIKRNLEKLTKSKKLLKKDKDDTTFYRLNTRKSN
jgi:repressor of nif and glnA expression